MNNDFNIFTVFNFILLKGQNVSASRAKNEGIGRVKSEKSINEATCLFDRVFSQNLKIKKNVLRN